MTIEKDQLFELLQKHFEEYQLDIGTLSYSAVARAAAIKKKLSLMALNSGVSNLSLEKTRSYQDVENETLRSILLHFVDNLVAVDINSSNREPVERLMDLVAAVVAVSSEDIAEHVVARTIQFSTVLLERVRSQSLILIGYLAFHFSKSRDEWAQEWFEALKDVVLPRLTDKGQTVRNSAIRASANILENSLNAGDTQDLLEALSWNLWHDPSVANRTAALDALPISKQTVGHVVARIRDVKEKVRVKALNILRTKVDPVSHLTSDHFAEVIRCGLSDRCGSTGEATKTLICSKWMKAAKFDPVKLLKQMDVIVNEEECEKAMKVVLDVALRTDWTTTFLNELSDPEIRAFQAGASFENSMAKTINSAETLSAEELFLARVACSTAQESTSLAPGEKFDIMSNATPDIPVLCEIFQSCTSRLTKAMEEGNPQKEDEYSFLCSQLLQLARLGGLNEEGSRRHFSSFLKSFISSDETPDDVVEGCIESLQASYEEESEFFEAVTQIILHLSSKADGGSGFESSRMLRILSILTIVFENSSSSLSSNRLLEEASTTIISAVTNPNSLVREVGVSTLGKLGLFTDKERVTEDFKPILLEVASNEKEKVAIRIQAMLALSDWSLLFAEMLYPCNIQGKAISFLSIVEKMIQHENPSVVAIAAEVSIKLLFSNRICESQLLARLLVLFFDPDQKQECENKMGYSEYKDDVGSLNRLQQLLSLFFAAYAIRSECGRCAMLGSLELALGLAFDKASSKSNKKKTSVPLLKMIEFVASTAETGKLASACPSESHQTIDVSATSESDVDHPVSTPSVALAISVQVARFMIGEQSLPVTQIRVLSKFIGSQQIEIKEEDRAGLLEFADLLEELGMTVTDALSLSWLSPMNENMSAIDQLAVDNKQNKIFETIDSCEDTVTEDGLAIHEDANTTASGDSTVEDSVMYSMATLTVHDKENDSNVAPSKLVQMKSTNRKPEVLAWSESVSNCK